MGDVIPFLPRDARQAERQRRSLHRQSVRLQHAGKFRIEMPVLLYDLQRNYEQMSEAIWHYVEDFCAAKGAADIVDDLRLVFVGGLQAAQDADQAWFTEFVAPGVLLLCWEADAPPLTRD